VREMGIEDEVPRMFFEEPPAAAAETEETRGES
jgi:hypothetical protein